MMKNRLGVNSAVELQAGIRQLRILRRLCYSHGTLGYCPALPCRSTGAIAPSPASIHCESRTRSREGTTHRSLRAARRFSWMTAQGVCKIATSELKSCSLRTS
ncbi:hypothetical protein AV530_015333 [Patagioenas fasciata monilis]|uniref:Uncharacterized protein n=1 Tax=Patagioenas fasciata monilis TaxID=372326 RepID=A0A1V4K1P9_PATFA|nr:hypothetical protein AV530_015333 [Patagioenas fasciata monilis]